MRRGALTTLITCQPFARPSISYLSFPHFHQNHRRRANFPPILLPCRLLSLPHFHREFLTKMNAKSLSLPNHCPVIDKMDASFSSHTSHQNRLIAFEGNRSAPEGEWCFALDSPSFKSSILLIRSLLKLIKWRRQVIPLRMSAVLPKNHRDYCQVEN